jgi:PAS domain S-box-containing protein
MVKMRFPLRKTITSILLGLICFLGSKYALTFSNPPYVIALEWIEILPFMAAMAFGGRYGLVAGFLGLGAFFPFILYPNNGWSNVGTSLLLLAVYFLVGYFSMKRKNTPAFWNSPLFVYPLVVTLYSLLFSIIFPLGLRLNPPFWYPDAVMSISPAILSSIIVKTIVNFLVELFFADFLLRIPIIRKILGLEIRKESRLNNRIGGFAFLASGSTWFLLIIFNRIFIDQTFPRGLFSWNSPYELIALFLLFSMGSIVGSLLIIFTEARLSAQDDLALGKDKYQQIFEQAADGIFTTFADGKIFDVNKRGCALTGYSFDELTAMNLGDLLSKPKAHFPQLSISKIESEGKLFYEESLIHKNGSKIVSEVNTQKMPDGMFQTVVRDITDRRTAELSFRKTEKHYQVLFENSPLGYQSLDADGNIIEINQAWLMTLGYEREEVIGHWFGDFLIPEMVDAFRERFPKFKADGEVHNQFKMVHKSGKVIDVAFDGRIGYDNKGGFKQTHCVLNDITTKQIMLNNLTESERRFRTTIENAPLPVMLHAEDGEILMISRSWINLSGYSLEEIPTMNDWLAKAYGNASDGVKKVVDRTYTVEGADYEGEFTITAKSGKRIIWDFSSSNLGLLSDGRKLVVSMAMDITERKKVENENRKIHEDLKHLLEEADLSREVLLNVIEDQKLAEEQLNQLNLTLEEKVEERTAQLVAANKELEAFSYSVSHDLRAPLRGIDGWSLALKEDYADKLDEQGNLYINRVRSEIQRMGQLIDGLLLLSRVTRMESNQTTVNLSDMVRTIASRITEQNSDRKFEIQIEPDVQVQGDYDLLNIVFTNLLDNAAKFSSKVSSPLIEFGREQINGKPTYFIRDNGAGFDMAYAKNLFGAFQRMHKQSEFPGTGVGLATVQRIINRHHGRVWAEAKVNEGATFFFTLWEEN